MILNRRHFLSTAIGAAAASAVPATLRTAFASDGRLELTAGPSRKKLYREDAEPSDLWTYNGSSPGPELRVRQGDRLRVRLINNLEEPTSIHWHGIRIANAMDGVSGLTQEPVPPGGTFDHDFAVPDAGTYWYHAHNKSWNQVARGLYGPLIVDEPEPAFDRAHDLTLVIDDWRLTRTGALDLASIGSLMDWSHAGRLGNWLTVNGTSLPGYNLKAGEHYRLRLINAANARVLEIDPGRFNAEVLALDGQALPKAEPPRYAPLLIGPAQRVDLLVTPKSGGDFSLEELSGEPFAFASFVVDGSDRSPGPRPELGLNSIPEPDLKSARTVVLDMTGGAMGGAADIVYQGKRLQREDFRETGQMWAFNGVANLADKPFFSARKGETIVVETKNNTAFMHAMHVHGHHFRVIERGGSTIDDGKPWRDTFLVGPDQTTRIAFVADNPGKWLLHCHMLEHAAAGMNTWFEVA